MTKTPKEIDIMNALDNIESGFGFSTDILLARFFDTTRKTIWEWSKTREEFPNPVKIGPNTTRWNNAEVKVFLDSLNHPEAKKVFPAAGARLMNKPL